MSELISRQKLIDKLNSYHYTIIGMRCGKKVTAEIIKEYHDHVIEVIESQPPADVPDTNVGEWVPFTGEYEKNEGRVVLTCPIPDNDEEIMVTDGKYVWEDTFMNDGQDCWLDSSNKFLVEEVTAWMPKPEPYKGVE